MHESSAVGMFLNQLIFDRIARLIGLNVPNGQHAVPDHIVMILLIALGLISFAFWMRGRLSVENPPPIQHLLEVAIEGIRSLMREVIGNNSVRFFPLIGTLAFYILVCNIIGMLPGFISPTSNLNITVSCAICVFVYYNYVGIRKHGLLKYMKHFAGPVWWLAWLMFPVEIISHMARPFSLSMRLFGNIFAEELIIGSFNKYIFPFVISLPVMFLGLFASTIQAFIFILLTMVYLSGAVEESHEESTQADESSFHHQNHAAAA